MSGTYSRHRTDQASIDAVQAKVRRRVLSAFVRRGWLEADEAEEMLGWGETRPKVPRVQAVFRAYNSLILGARDSTINEIPVEYLHLLPAWYGGWVRWIGFGQRKRTMSVHNGLAFGA